MTTADYLIILIFFAGLLLLGFFLGRKISSSKEMFIAGKNSNWWISGLSTYMTIFSASTFVVWGGVAYRSGLVAAFLGMMLGIASFAVGKWISGRWNRMGIESPAQYLTVRFGDKTLKFYSIILILGRAVHTAVSLYAISIMVVALIPLPAGSFFADPATGHLSVVWAVAILGLITFIYTTMGGYLAVLMTDVVQFAVLMAMILVLVPLSIHEVGGWNAFASAVPEGYFKLVSNEYNAFWMVLWCILNFFMIGGDWAFVQRYISVPNAKQASKSSYLVGVLYLLTPVIWYIPAMVYRVLEPGANPEQAYILMSQRVLGPGLLGFMIAAMMSATLSMVSGTLNVFANVFTYDIYVPSHPEADEKKKISVGRLFTLVYGLAITVIAMIIPLLGGAEKVVVTVLTIVINPIFIPSIWGLFSKRLSQRDLILSMCLTYVVALAVKFKLIFTGLSTAHPQMTEAIIGCILPVFFLCIFELAGRRRETQAGFLKVAEMEKAQEEETGAASSDAYSRMAIYIMMGTFLTLGIISLILILFYPENSRTLLTVGLSLTAVAAAVLGLLKVKS